MCDASTWDELLGNHAHLRSAVNTAGVQVPPNVQQAVLDACNNGRSHKQLADDFVQAMQNDGGGGGWGGGVGVGLGGGGWGGGGVGLGGGGGVGLGAIDQYGNPITQQAAAAAAGRQQGNGYPVSNRGGKISDPFLVPMQMAQLRRNDDPRFRGKTFIGEMSEADQMAVQRGTDELSNPEEYKHMKYISMAYGGLVFIIACIIGYFVFKSIYLNLISDTSQDVQDAVTTINMYQVLGIGITIIVAIALFKFSFSKVHAEKKRDYLKPVRHQAGRTAAARDQTLMPGSELRKMADKRTEMENAKHRREKEINDVKHNREVAKQALDREHDMKKREEDGKREAEKREHESTIVKDKREAEVQKNALDRSHELAKQKEKLDWAAKNSDLAKVM